MGLSPRLHSVGKKTGPNPTDRAKKGTKRSILTDGDGIPLAIAVSGANVHDIKLLNPTLDSLMLEKPNGDHHLCGDKAYDSDEARMDVRERGYKPHIRSRGEEKDEKKRSPHKKARRWVVERTHSWLNKFRRLFIRWEKKTENYEAMLHLAAAIITLRAAGAFV
jgi:putative transposase